MHNHRGKRKLLQRALDSIQIAEPPQRAKVLTESAEPYEEPPATLQRPTVKDDKGMRVLRRYYRYKQGEEEEAALSKHKSLDLAKRQLKRRSEQRLNHSLERRHPSQERSPYLPLNERKLPIANSKEGLVKVVSREARKLSLPKKAFRSRDQLESIGADQLKEMARLAMKKGSHVQALRFLQRAGSGEVETDLQGLDMWGVCLMNLRKFEQAVVRLGRVVMLDPRYSKKAYISLALCQNQLNHAERCLHYINQCISLFPDYYEAYYFKGKLLFKQQLYAQAIDILLRAAFLNPNKQEIKLLIAECYLLQGNHSEALLYYQRYLGEITVKNARQAVKYGTLLISAHREAEAITVLQTVLTVTEGTGESQAVRVEANAHLSLAYYRRGNYELCAMRGEEVLTRGGPKITLQVIKTMITSKIMEHDYYGGIYFLRRLDHAQSEGKELSAYVQFLEGVALLTKRRVQEAVGKLKQLPSLLDQAGMDEFSIHINRTFRLFLLYGLFLMGRYSECLGVAASQREVGVQAYWEDSLGYIEFVCRAMMAYNNGEFGQAEKWLVDCVEAHPQRAEANLYLGLLQFKLCQEKEQSKGKQGEDRRASIFHHLAVCADRFGSSCSNYSAFIFYYRALLAAWEGEWAVAAAEVELAIEKSEDNFSNFYYLRALVLANLQNFKQAISDASLALSIVENASAFLLRARCLQIDGNPGQAFADLQTFIALRPDDKQVHKFAGHLLFENGAFEDALQAYGQGEVSSTDLEVFLTRSKTHFLLGNFLSAAQDLQEAARLHPRPAELRFDQKVIQWLARFLHQYTKDQCEDSYQFDQSHLSDCLLKLRSIYKEGSQNDPKYGKIFKMPQFLTLSAACQFYGGEYGAAIDSFIEAIELKQAALERGEEQAEGEFEEEQAQKLVFINQMYYNVAVCCCMLHDYPNAERYLQKCVISPELHNYDTYLELLDQVAGRQAVEENAQYLDLFSLRNKLSKYMPRLPVPFLSNKAEEVAFRPLKICIPYPKVEPPEITPPFDPKLIQQIDLNEVERRVEAPWIYREKDSIKFTERIEVFSRFQLEKSEAEERRPQMGSPSSSLDALPLNLREEGIRERLKLDARIEEKLNKLIAREK